MTPTSLSSKGQVPISRREGKEGNLRLLGQALKGHLVPFHHCTNWEIEAWNGRDIYPRLHLTREGQTQGPICLWQSVMLPEEQPTDRGLSTFGSAPPPPPTQRGLLPTGELDGEVCTAAGDVKELSKVGTRFGLNWMPHWLASMARRRLHGCPICRLPKSRHSMGQITPTAR